MSKNINKLLEIAENEVGYLEKATNDNLDDMTANAGTGNWTKYGRDLIREIGSPYSNGVAWCDMFVDWCFIKSYGKSDAKELLGGWSAYTPTSAQYFKNMNQWYTSNPKAGDVIFFKNSQRICHTGIVYKVDTQKVYTIEGNTSSEPGMVTNGGCVRKKSYLLTNSTYIAGYGRPKYDVSPTTPVYIDKKYTYGIDISQYQGKIDFTKVKSAGIKFAILRTTISSGKIDGKWYEYLDGCKKNGIQISCYKYSYARTESDSINEANQVVKLLNGEKMKIWLDLENANQVAAIGKSGITKVANAFIRTCENAGYEVGIYCNLNWYKNYIDESLKKYCNVWMARYGQNNGKLEEKYKPNIGESAWQYTSRGQIDGIQGDVDLDVIYTPDLLDINSYDNSKPSITPTTTLAHFTNYVATQSSNLIIRTRSGNEFIKTSKSLKKGTQIKAYNAYDGWVQIDEKENKWCFAAYISSNFVGTITGCTALNFRDSDSTEGNKLCSKPVDTEVKLFAQSTKTNWVLTEYGWCNPKYLKITPNEN